MRRRSAWKEWLRSLLLALVVVWLLTALVALPKVVNLSSMEPNLYPGDLVLVNLWTPGPRLPVSIGIPFTRIRIDKPSFPVWRIPGNEVKFGDVLVFNYPPDSGVVDRKPIYVKRCIGIPGDTIQLRLGELYINRQLTLEHFTTMTNYEIRGKKSEFIALCEAVDPEDSRSRFSLGEVHLINLSHAEADSLRKQFPELTISNALYDAEHYAGKMFPAQMTQTWSPDDYGPLYVPKAGDSIALDAVNLLIYNDLLNRFEPGDFSHRGDSVFVNGKYRTHYTFAQNYYFAVGDNRHNSIDSRHWGFIPETHVIGKVALTLFSIDPHAPWYRKIRWNKILQRTE